MKINFSNKVFTPEQVDFILDRRQKLRNLGFDVRVVEIKGLLQAELENIFKAYVFETVGADIYYDPKEMEKSEIPKVYYKCSNYGLNNCPELIKTGWESLNGILTIKIRRGCC